MKKVYTAVISEVRKRRILYAALFFVIILNVAFLVAGYFKTSKISHAPDSLLENGDSIAKTDESIPTTEENPSENSTNSNSNSNTSGKKSMSSTIPVSPPSRSSTSPASIPPSSPESPSAFVAFYADSQSDTDTEDQNHSRVVGYLQNSGANPIFHAGDLMEDGTQNSLDRFNSVTSTLRSTRTFYSALGNNDRKIGDSSLPSPLYLSNFSYPNNEQWYSVNVGNLHLVVLDSAFSSGSSAQLAWLQADLAAVPSSEIVGVMYHHPAFNSAVHNILRDNRVDFVITGHYHSYFHEVDQGIHYYVLPGQSSIGYVIARVFSDYVQIFSYNSLNALIESVQISNR